MGLNKKQKKQIDATRNKIRKLQQLLTAARSQPDEPGDVTKFETGIKALEAEIAEIRSDGSG